MSLTHQKPIVQCDSCGNATTPLGETRADKAFVPLPFGWYTVKEWCAGALAMHFCSKKCLAISTAEEAQSVESA